MHKQVKNIWIKVKQYACQLYDRKYKIKGYHPPRIIYIYSWSQHYFLCKGIHVIRILCRAHEIKGEKTKGGKEPKSQSIRWKECHIKTQKLFFFIFHFFLLHNRVFFVLKFSIVKKKLRKWHSLQNIYINTVWGVACMTIRALEVISLSLHPYVFLEFLTITTHYYYHPHATLKVCILHIFPLLIM